MNIDYKKVLYINLTTLTYDFKIHEDLWEFLGGVGIAYKLMADNIAMHPIILATGPLSGYFPYISKSALLFVHEDKIVEKFGGGPLAAKMNLADLDAIVIHGSTKDNLHISIFEKEVSFTFQINKELESRVNDVQLSRKKIFSQNYHSFGFFGNNPLKLDGDISINIDSSESYDMKNFYDYDSLYKKLLDDYKKLSVEPRNNPSCLGCPMGCEKSHEGEDNENVAVLPRCLISCAYAESIYKSIPIVYGCLSSVGYKYKHEDLEKLPSLVGGVKVSLDAKKEDQIVPNS